MLRRLDKYLLFAIVHFNCLENYAENYRALSSQNRRGLMNSRPGKPCESRSSVRERRRRYCETTPFRRARNC